MIIACETSLALVLLVAGGLMIESFNRMRQTELGIDVDGVLTFMIRPAEARVPPAGAPAYIDRMLGAIMATPGVTDATVDGGAPVSGTARSSLFIEGRETAPGAAPPVLRHYVATGHFTTLGIPLIRGRSFTAQDIAGRPRVAIISEAAAKRFWPGEDPIGRRVRFAADNPEDASAEIVGIVGDVMYEPLDTGPNQNSFYTPYAQFTYSWRQYFVRTAGDPLSLVGPIRHAVRGVDPDVPLTEVQSLRSLIGASWKRQRFDAVFFGIFALLALGLAVSGIYAVVSYAVGQRTREMGIRIALGSRPRNVVKLVVSEGLTYPAIGAAAGLLLAWGAASVLRASLYGIGASDPRVIGSVMLLLFLAAVGACLIPARRATRVDPCEAMRAE
jgi:putative ABC transport system permease protein